MKVAGLAEDTSPLNIENLNLQKTQFPTTAFGKLSNLEGFC